MIALASAQRPDHSIDVPFPASHQGRPVVVSAVLERTCVVFYPGDPDHRFLLRLEAVEVDPAELSYWPSRRIRALTIKSPDLDVALLSRPLTRCV